MEVSGQGAKRLDGWKAIAAYFNRDRTTVMRWARDRHLPVRRMPGGKQGSVFCFEHELAAWALRQEEVTGAPDDAVPVEGSATTTPAIGPSESVNPDGPDAAGIRRWPGRTALIMGITALMALSLTMAWLVGRATTSPVATLAMPRAPAVARDYVAARDHWARRTQGDLAVAIGLYQGVIRRDPGFAPAYVGMAEAWLIIREYGDVPEAEAYRRAQFYATAALRLDPDLAGAHRALGFIDYWRGGQTKSALARFRRAIALDGSDPLNYFWYANVLADIGEDAAAQAAYDRARLLSPGSRVIAVEQACAHWQAGRDAEAFAQLTALARGAPDDATIHNCLAFLHIGQGDIIGYARELRIRATLRGEPNLLRVSNALDAAIRRDPTTAVDTLIAEGRREIAAGERKLRETPAFYASSMGDRPALVALLTEANDLGERWGAASLTRRIARRWRDDAQIQRLLKGVVAPANPQES